MHLFAASTQTFLYILFVCCKVYQSMTVLFIIALIIIWGELASTRIDIETCENQLKLNWFCLKALGKSTSYKEVFTFLLLFR